MKTFDLIVIGAGSGLDVAVEAANQGLKTAIIEAGPLGGTCLNRGCIPSKMVIHTADVAEEIKNANLFGLRASWTHPDFRKVTFRASHTVDEEAKAIKQSLRQRKNPVLFASKAKFISPYTLQVGTETITGKKIVIAAGARPAIPLLPGLNKVSFMTSTEALRQTKLPKSLIIIGGGYIGAELGHFYAALGCPVTVIQRGPLLLSREDKDISALFTTIWKRKYGIVCNCEITEVEQKGKNIVVNTKHDGKKRRFVAEKLLIATGVRSNSDTLDLAKTGVKTNEKGFIVVNKYMETTVPNIYALGDIAGVYLFKHSANLEAQSVLNSVLGKKQAVDYFPMPHAIFTSPQIAGVGMTEQEAQQQGKKYVIGKYEYKNTGMGAAMAEKDGLVKFIVETKTRAILGCHIIGPEASTLIHEVVVALKADRKRALDIIREAVHVHPALSEVVQRAAGSVPV